MPKYPDKDCYATLGVDPEAPQEVIEAARKALNKKLHPDNGDSGNEELLKEVNEAYDFLKDAESRREYDEWRKENNPGSATRAEPEDDPPRPSLSPDALSFGTVVQGKSRTLKLTLENHGGLPKVELNFNIQNDPAHFSIVSYDPPDAVQFPKTLEIKFDSSGLPAPGEVEDWIEVSLDGVTARALLSARIKTPVPRPAAPTAPKPATSSGTTSGDSAPTDVRTRASSAFRPGINRGWALFFGWLAGFGFWLLTVPGAAAFVRANSAMVPEPVIGFIFLVQLEDAILLGMIVTRGLCKSGRVAPPLVAALLSSLAIVIVAAASWKAPDNHRYTASSAAKVTVLTASSVSGWRNYERKTLFQPGDQVWLYAEALDVNRNGRASVTFNFEVWKPGDAVASIHRTEKYSRRTRDTSCWADTHFLVPENAPPGKWSVRADIRNNLTGQFRSVSTQFAVEGATATGTPSGGPVGGPLTLTPPPSTPNTDTLTPGTGDALNPAAAPAPSVRLTAEPESITAGGSAMLSWTTEGASTVRIQPGVGPVPARGSLKVTPGRSTTYSLIAQGSGRSANARARITVLPSGPTEGTIVWQGKVHGTMPVSIEGTQASIGAIIGSGLPGLPCNVRIENSKRATLQSRPAQWNGWKLIVFQVHGRGRVRVRISWSLLQYDR
jgi:DnaJ domain